MGLPPATAFRFGQGHFEAVFNFYFNSRRDQNRARQIHALERVAILFLGLRHDARNAPSCFKSSPETMKPQKAGRMTQTSTCWTVYKLYKAHELLNMKDSISMPDFPSSWTIDASSENKFKVVWLVKTQCDSMMSSHLFNSYPAFPASRMMSAVPTTSKSSMALIWSMPKCTLQVFWSWPREWQFFPSNAS